MLNKSMIITSLFCALFMTKGIAQNNNPFPSSNYTVPETEYEKLQDLDRFEETIQSKENENEEWKQLLSTVENIKKYIGFSKIETLNESISKLKLTIISSKKKNNFSSMEQFRAEDELLNSADGLIPTELRLVEEWKQSIKSENVRKELNHFLSLSSELLRRIFKDRKYKENTPIDKTENFVFNDVSDVDNFIQQLDNLLKNELNSHLDLFISNISGKITLNDQEIKNAKLNRNEIVKIKDKKLDINSLAIWVGLPAFCITILLLYLIPEWYYRKNSLKERDFTVLLELITVFLLTMTILILGLSGMLKEEVLGTLIGGISGYVLNRGLNKKENAIKTVQVDNKNPDYDK